MQHLMNIYAAIDQNRPSTTPVRKIRSIKRTAFTLIELLVVIAIIGILAALLFPVFSAAQENARANNTIAHMHDVQLGLGLYKLDNKSYPPVLFAYACDQKASSMDNCNINDTMQSIATDKNAVNELVGLYPEYVRAWTSFQGLDDEVDDGNGHILTSGTNGYGSYGAVGSGPQPNYLCSDGTLNVANGGTTTLAPPNNGSCQTPYRSFYVKDGMDVGPEVSGANQLAGGAGAYTYVVRYQTSWTSWNGSFDPSKTVTGAAGAYPAGSPWINYTRQLAWQNPPSDTYVTAVTTHIPNSNKIIVLYQSGAAIKSTLQLSTTPPNDSNETFMDTTTGSIAPPVGQLSVGDTGCPQTQPPLSTDSVACSYVPSQFWAINTSGSAH